ncbi:hypothetical protein [Stieleria varia]|nr:hypothetical protein [Stieleria varia]
MRWTEATHRADEHGNHNGVARSTPPLSERDVTTHSEDKRDSRITVGRLVAKLVVGVACCVVLSLLIVPALQNASSATGELFPTSPDQYRRIDTGLGVSIVRPQYWDVHDNSLLSRATDPDQYSFFYMRPYQYLNRAAGASISVRRLGQKPTFDEAEFIPRTFAGRPAWEGLVVNSSNRFSSIPTFCIHVDDGTIWYTVSYSTTFSMTEIPDGTREFLESVRFDSDTKAGG